MSDNTNFPQKNNIDDHQRHIHEAVLKRFQALSHRSDYIQMRRLIWRIGELKIQAAVPDLMALIPAKDELMNYCVAWALGRIGDNRALLMLKDLRAKTRSKAVKRIAMEAILALASEKQRADLVGKIIRRLPKSVKDALSANDENRLATAAGPTIFQGGAKAMSLLEALYRVSLKISCAKSFVLSTLSQIPFKANYFRGIRNIYKAAEFRCDADIIGLSAMRFEMESSRFYIAGGCNYVTIPHTGKHVRFKTEIVKSDSRLAYSNRTRNYFRKRVWRLLRQLGRAEDPAYVTLAMAVLMLFKDEHACAPKKMARYSWQPDDQGQWGYVSEPPREYDAFGGYVAFNHILHGNSERYHLSPNGLSWFKTTQRCDGKSAKLDKTGPAPREESFPMLWDQRPNELWKLISESQCKPVHQFAVRALQDNACFCEQISTEDIKLLLTKPYAATIALGVDLACRQYNPGKPDIDILQTLLSADLTAARHTAQQWVNHQPELLLDSAGLMVRILTSAYADVRQWGHRLLDRVELTRAHVQGLIARIMVFLLNDRTDADDAVIADVGALFLGRWKDECCRMDIGVIGDLLRHRVCALQVLAAELLLQHDIPLVQMPVTFLRDLVEADSSELRSIGVRLISDMPENWLLDRVDLIHRFCISEAQQVRHAVLPLIKKLVSKKPAFGKDLFDRLFPSVFRKAPSLEFRQDLVRVLSEELATHTHGVDPNTIWRLLQAKAPGAKQLGACILRRSDFRIFSTRQWAWLGNHAFAQVRQWSWQAYKDHPSVIEENMANGLRLLNTDWEDTREFALTYFRENFTVNHWTPELVGHICTNIRKDIQQFGRELITSFFDDAHGGIYFLKLSQHPSVNVQLFAADFLETYVAGNFDRLEQLVPYFSTILSQVNRGRVIKARIFKYLHRLALDSADGAAMVASICKLISTTKAIGDRETCVRILHDINQNYPQVSTILTSIPVPRRAIKAITADHAFSKASKGLSPTS